MIPNSKTTLAVLWMTTRRLKLHIIMQTKALLKPKVTQRVLKMETKEKMARSGLVENEPMNTNRTIFE